MKKIYLLIIGGLAVAAVVVYFWHSKLERENRNDL